MSAAALLPTRWIASTSARSGSFGADAPHECLARSEDDGDEVVEVVSDASGQPGHGSEALRAVELLEDLLALGGVLGDGEDPSRSIRRSPRAGRPKAKAPSARPPGLRAGTIAPTVAWPSRARSQSESSIKAASPVDRESARGQAGLVPPEQEPGGAVPPAHPAVEVELGDRNRGGVDESRESLLVAPEGLVEDGALERGGRHPGE